MDKVYYLLRNNRKTGPYTIGELLQQSLRPADLIWMEGRSTSWTRVAEMELAPNTDQIPAPTPVITLSPEVFREVAKSDPHPVVPEAEAPIEFIDHRKEKHQAVRELFAAALVTLFVAVGVVGGRSLFLGKRGFGTPPAAVNRTEGKLQSTQEYTARQAEPEKTADTAASTLGADSTITVAPVAYSSRPRVEQRPPKSDTTDEAPATPSTTATLPPMTTDKVEEPKPAPPKEPATTKQPAADEKKEEKPEAPKAEPEEKKRGFLRGLFKKKKKDGEE